MKKSLPLLVLCLMYISCINKGSSYSLQREIDTTPLLSATFDSLLQKTRTLPASERISVLINAASRNETNRKVPAKQEALLLEALPLATKQERKQILLYLVRTYQKANYDNIPDKNTKAFKRCEELERNYSLSKEERWEIMQTKVLILDKAGQQNLYMPILFQLLEEHRQTDKPALVIEDLRTIANRLVDLGDPERALTTYKEAYEMSINHNLTQKQNECLSEIINTAAYLERNKEVLAYYHKIGIDSMVQLMPNAYRTLAKCYVHLGKGDSARIYFKKEIQTSSVSSFNMASYCYIAKTFTNEQREDSAATYLKKAMECYQLKAAHTRKKNIKSFLPTIFLEVYPSFATLLQQNGKTKEAGEVFALIEPLTEKTEKLSAGLKKQIDALTLYATFCQTTQQYEKGLALLFKCDSLRTIYTDVQEKRRGQNIIERFKMQELLYTIDLQKAELSYSQRVLIAIAGASLILLSAIAVLARLYRQRRRQLSAIISKDREIEQLRQAALGSVPAASTLSPAEELFRAAEQRVTSGKLFLNKELSLELLARDLGTNRTYLSACVNTCSGGNFNQWINNYRIAYVLERIDSAPNLLQLASEAGFLSPDSFYRNFKRCTQMTTSQYLKEKGKTPD